MTLEFLLNELCNLGIRHNLVNYAAAGGSVYSLNSETIDSYPYFFFSPTEDIRIEKNFTTYGITVFYVDRLLGDNMNDTQVYSNGTLAIQNLMRQVKAMDGVVGVDDYYIRVFSETEKMADKVNGAYARVNITTLNSYNCSIYFDETGAPMGTYVPDVIKDTSVLDALASKEWVKRLVASASISGMTPEEFEEILSDYVLEKNFATINGEKITNRKKFALVDQSAYTQDIQNIYEAISGATPEDYSALQEQVSANTENITNLQSAITNIDDYCFFVSGYSTPWDARNSDDLVDYVLSLGDDFPKARVFVMTGTNPVRWTQYSVYKVSGNTIYVYAVYTRGVDAVKTSYGTYTKGVAPNSGDFSEFELSNNINNYIQTLRTDVSALKNSKQNKLTAGRGITIDSDTNVISADVASSNIHYLADITQAAYDALATKDPNTLYIIKG